MNKLPLALSSILLFAIVLYIACMDADNAQLEARLAAAEQEIAEYKQIQYKVEQLGDNVESLRSEFKTWDGLIDNMLGGR
jgi:type II secretory pathway component PulM